jgi:hypothetical protein
MEKMSELKVLQTLKLNNKISCICLDGDIIYIGTENGYIYAIKHNEIIKKIKISKNILRIAIFNENIYYCEIYNISIYKISVYGFYNNNYNIEKLMVGFKLPVQQFVIYNNYLCSLEWLRDRIVIIDKDHNVKKTITGHGLNMCIYKNELCILDKCNHNIIMYDNKLTIKRKIDIKSNTVYHFGVCNDYLYMQYYKLDNDKIIYNEDGLIIKEININYNCCIKHIFQFGKDIYFIDGGEKPKLINYTNNYEVILPFFPKGYLISNNHLYLAGDKLTKIGEFYLRDYKNLDIKIKQILFEAAKVFHRLHVSKDIRLLIYRLLFFTKK